MAALFEDRRPATSDEITRLIASFGIPSMSEALSKAEISEIRTLDEFGSLPTVISGGTPETGRDPVLNVAELADSWAQGGGDPIRDQGPFRHFVQVAADPAFAPELLFEPTPLTKAGWWLIDGVHRAVALYAVRAAAGEAALELRVFVLPAPVR